MTGRNVVVATEAEKTRGRALQDSLDHLRRARAALQVATADPNGYRAGAFREAAEQLYALEKALRLLATI